MKKKRNHRQNKNASTAGKKIVKSDNEIIEDEIKKVANRLMSMDDENLDVTEDEDIDIDDIDVDNIDIDNIDIDNIDIDEDMAERLAYYESESIEDDDESEDDTDISEFLSRDYDIVAESRRRVNQPGNPVERAARPRKTKDNRRKSKKESKKESRKESKKPSGDKSSSVSIINRWLDFYHKYTMNILFSVLGVLAVILVVVIIITLVSGDKKTDSENAETKTTNQQEQSTADEQDSTTEPTTEEAVEPEAEDSDIHSLIVSYIDAAYIQADMEKVKLYVDDVTNINEDEYKSRQKYIEAYQNIKCYKFELDEADTYVVFVTYDEKIYNIETPAPSGKLFIIKKNPSDQKLYIHNMTEDEELDVYIASKTQQINNLSNEVSKRLEAAKAADEELKAVLELMGNVGKNSEESSSEGEETSSAAE